MSGKRERVDGGAGGGGGASSSSSAAAAAAAAAKRRRHRLELEDEEPAPRSEAEGKVLELCREHPDGVPQQVMQDALDENAGIKDEMAAAINRLSVEQRLRFISINDVIHYKLRPAALAAKFRTLSSEDVAVYDEIERASNKGIWSRDLKRALHGQLTGPAVDKSLKHLHSKLLIKSVKSIASRSKKVVMLYDLIPSLDVQGRCWFSGHTYDEEFFAKLREFVIDVVRRRHQATPAMATEEVKESGAFEVAVTKDDMIDLFRSLAYEGTLEPVPEKLHDEIIAATIDQDDEDAAKGAQSLYRLRPDRRWGNVLSHIPCTVCPVRDQCVPGGRVNPQACVYMTEWLDF